MEFSDDQCTELKRIQRLFEKVENQSREREIIMKEGNKFKIEQEMGRMQANEKRWMKEAIMKLKQNFKHIYGMWPSTAHFIDEQHRMNHWQTDLVIKRKILDPSKRLIDCKKEADKMQKE